MTVKQHIKTGETIEYLNKKMTVIKVRKHTIDAECDGQIFRNINHDDWLFTDVKQLDKYCNASDFLDVT